MLHLKHFLGMGATRLCFFHPEDADKCVKVAMRYRNRPALQQELEAVTACVPHIGSYLPEYLPELIETNLGPGLVCEIIKDADGTPSLPLTHYVLTNTLNEEVFSQLTEFSRILTSNHIPLYDFNPDNFLVQIKGERQVLRFTDLKTYNHYKPYTYLRLERYIPAISRHIVRRRLNRLFTWIKNHAQVTD
jgi:hypothetical protein